MPKERTLLKKETHHLWEYQYLLYWFCSTFPSLLYLLDNFLKVPNCSHLQIFVHTRLDTPLTWIHHKLKNHSPNNFSTTSNSTKFRKHQLLTYMLYRSASALHHRLFELALLLHLNSTVYMNNTVHPKYELISDTTCKLWCHLLCV